MSMAKIAEELGISKGTVQGYIEKRGKRLRKGSGTSRLVHKKYSTPYDFN